MLGLVVSLCETQNHKDYVFVKDKMIAYYNSCVENNHLSHISEFCPNPKKKIKDLDKYYMYYIKDNNLIENEK